MAKKVYPIIFKTLKLYMNNQKHLNNMYWMVMLYIFNFLGQISINL
jgi:hypothetical protein